MLIAGGDIGAALGGTVPLSTSTLSSAQAEIYNAVSDAFVLVGSMPQPTEASLNAVALPNNEVLLVGGWNCYAVTYGTGPTAAACNATSFAGFQCDALQTAELYNENTQTFTPAGAGSGFLMTVARSGATANLIKGSGTLLDGKVLITGGSTGSTFTTLNSGLLPPGCGPFGQVAENSAEIYDPATDTFSATGAVPGCAAGTIPPSCLTGLPASCGGVGVASVITSATETGTTVTITSAANPPGLVVGNVVTVSGVSVAGYNGLWPITAIPSGTTFQYTDASGLTTPVIGSGYAAANTDTPIATASESGTTASIFMATSNPPNLILGDNVTISGMSVPGYNGTYAVTNIVSGTEFQYTALASGLGGGTGGFAAADTAQCGLVDSAAQLLNNGTVLVAGGDYLTFLGQSSEQAFVFVPSSATPLSAAIAASTFTQTFPMNVPRELPGIALLPSGDVLVAGGITGEAAACVGLPGACTGAGTPNACCTGVGLGSTCGAIDFMTNSSAEIYNPTTPSWTLTTGSSATPGAAGGMNVQRIATVEVFNSGPDAGLAILAGGVNSGTTNGTTPNFGTCIAIGTGIHQTTQTKTDLFDEAGGGVFTATGVLNQSRGGYGYGILTTGSHSGDLVVIGGECATGSLASAAIGNTEAGKVCGTKAKTDYYELFNPTSGTWSVGTALPASTPANSPGSGILP